MGGQVLAHNGFTPVNRVPHILLIYWVIKIASTTLGETGADMVSMTLELGYGSTILIFLGIFAGFLAVKLALKKYEPITYWLTFTASAIAGTAISDFIDRTLGLGYVLGSGLLVLLLMEILLLWYRVEGSIQVEKITSGSSEIFYWLAFLIANTLGTAAGDLLADDLGMGFGLSAVILSGVLLVIGLLHFYSSLSGTLLFWLAFVLTRPFGATFGDFLTKSADAGGLDFGTIWASLFFAAILTLAIVRESWLERSGKPIAELD